MQENTVRLINLRKLILKIKNFTKTRSSWSNFSNITLRLKQVGTFFRLLLWLSMTKRQILTQHKDNRSATGNWLSSPLSIWKKKGEAVERNYKQQRKYSGHHGLRILSLPYPAVKCYPHPRFPSKIKNKWQNASIADASRLWSIDLRMVSSPNDNRLYPLFHSAFSVFFERLYD